MSFNPLYREDLQLLKKSISKQEKEATSVGRGVRSSASQGKRAALPEHGLAMQFIHG